MLEYAFIGFIAVVVIFLYVNGKKKFPVNCIVFENRSNGVVPFITKAGRHATKDGKYYYKIKYPAFPMAKVKKTSPFDFESLMIDNKGKNLLMLFSPEPDIYAPLDMVRELKDKIIMKVPIMDKEGKPVLNESGEQTYEDKEFPKIYIKGLKADVREFIAEETSQAQKIYITKKGLMDKYGPIILIIMTALAFAIILYSAADMLQSGSGIMADAANTASGIKGSILGNQIAIPK